MYTQAPGLLHHVMIRGIERQKIFNDDKDGRSLGYNFEKVIERISEIFQLEKEYITGKGRQQDRVMARDLLCYWAAVELGMSMVDLARKFDLTPAAVSCAVKRGEKIAKERDYQLET